MNDAQLWQMVRHIENELLDARLARSARLGHAPKRASRFAALFGRRPGASAVEVAPPRLREA
jgi:hypothetical protein